MKKIFNLHKNERRLKKEMNKKGEIFGYILIGFEICFILFLLLGNLSFVSSGSFFESLGKTQACSMLNISSNVCDSFWCEEVIRCDYNTTKEACICTIIINNTIIQNVTNYTISEAEYYNKTQVDALMEGFNLTIKDAIVKAGGMVGNQTVEEYLKNTKKEIIESTDSKIRDTINLGSGSSNSSNGVEPIWIFAIIILVAVFGYFFIQGQNKAIFSSPAEQGVGRPVYKKIHTKNEMGAEEIDKKIKRLEEVERKLTKKPAKQKPKEEKEYEEVQEDELEEDYEEDN